LTGFATIVGPARGADPQQRVADLRSEDRATRISAARALLQEPSLPDSMAEPAISFIKREVEQALVPEVLPDQKLRAYHSVPEGEATTLTRIRANPERYIDKPFYLIGLLTIGNLYASGFEDASDDYYALNFLPVNKEAKTTGEDRTVYLSRFMGKVLVERITRADEATAHGAPLVRLKCRIDSWRYEKLSDAIYNIRIVDWQAPAKGGKDWDLSAFAGIDAGYMLLMKCGKTGVHKCVDLIMSEQEFQGPDADMLLRALGILELLDLPRSQRNLVFRWLPGRAKRTRSPRARMWAERTYKSLLKDRLVL
jgi:hypothetical protein